MTTLLIITGPQGSGNHLFSKIFALHPDVRGWSALLDEYWIGHDQEPFAECWTDPTKLKNIPWRETKFWVTSISCPYADHGVVTVPDYEAFINAVIELGVDVKVGIIGRDTNILYSQQQRVRDRISLGDFTEPLKFLGAQSLYFLSQELVYLYREYYLKSLSEVIDFPIRWYDSRLAEILKNDPNTKYFRPVEPQQLDVVVRKVSGLTE